MIALAPFDRHEFNRRSFLSATTAAVGAVGACLAAWPLIDQINPDVRVRAASDIMEVDLAQLRPAEQRVAHWRGLPIFVVRRTPVMLQAMQDETFIAQLFDPHSQTRQQPSYAKNWHRSINPAYAVLVGICTHLGCIPAYYDKASLLDYGRRLLMPLLAHRTTTPLAGPMRGITRYNLAVPPHRFSRAGENLTWHGTRRMSCSLCSNPLSGFSRPPARQRSIARQGLSPGAQRSGLLADRSTLTKPTIRRRRYFDVMSAMYLARNSFTSLGTLASPARMCWPSCAVTRIGSVLTTLE